MIMSLAAVGERVTALVRYSANVFGALYIDWQGYDVHA